VIVKVLAFIPRGMKAWELLCNSMVLTLWSKTLSGLLTRETKTASFFPRRRWANMHNSNCVLVLRTATHLLLVISSRVIVSLMDGAV